MKQLRQARPVADAAGSPWRTLASMEHYRNPWLVVTEHQVIQPDGAPGIFGVVDPGDNVTILAIDDAGRVLLVRDFIYPVQQWAWALPSGGVEPHEDVPTAAARELREEGGVVADTWTLLGTYWTTPGIMPQTSHIFLVKDIAIVPAEPEPTEVMTRQWVPLTEALAMCQRGEIRHALAVLALFQAHLQYVSS